ncbi:G2/M phase-specific E3 ubiquitin-protein ligase-like isoform X2 [Huso huso]|uniref:G2/M phase-specific E3 ubiquitin-protein ligase-like isoform X2 n=1 Tax=Huso huso TaxID=61971 RepID=A0ABR1AB49_HUSHU
MADSSNLHVIIERAVAAGVRAALQAGTASGAQPPETEGRVRMSSVGLRQSHSVPLPSFPPLGRANFHRGNFRRRHKFYTKDVVCLPFHSGSSFTIPRGENRA